MPYDQYDAIYYRRMSIKDVALASARRARSRNSFAGVDNKVREDFAVLLDTNDPIVRRELNSRYHYHH